MNFKELTGLPRSHVVAEFASLLQRHLTERGDSFLVSKVHCRLTQICVHLCLVNVSCQTSWSILLFKRGRLVNLRQFGKFHNLKTVVILIHHF